MIDPVLAEMLVCPENHMPVREAGPSTIQALNTAIAAGKVKNKAGEAVSEAVDGLLVREDGARAYIIRDDIPIMLMDESVAPDTIGADRFSTD